MALARARSAALVGVDGHLVDVEVFLAQGLPGFHLIGLPDASLTESQDRVRAALLNSQARWPASRITVALSPATLPKRGSTFDLATAAAILVADGQLPVDCLEGVVLVGELGLDGSVRPVRGVLPVALAAAAAGLRRLIVPVACVQEAALVDRLEVRGVPTLSALRSYLRGDQGCAVPPGPQRPPESPDAPLDLADVVGQAAAKIALEVVAAGGHHMFLCGRPGVGKTMLAERLPGLLPPLSPAHALEVTSVHSVAGGLPAGSPLVVRPPFRAPHHSATVAAVLGGGSGLPRPGELSLAHRGVLFLDEAPEFARGVLDALRQPLESGSLTVARAGGSARFPARVQLILAANPCPCGRPTTDELACTCTPAARRRYLGRLSGPLLDRVDVRLTIGAVSPADLRADRDLAETSATVASRVAAARRRSARRWQQTPWACNAEVPGTVLRRTSGLVPEAGRLLRQQVDRGRLSMRGHDRVLRLAWTIADLAERDHPGVEELYQALGLHCGEGSDWTGLAA